MTFQMWNGLTSLPFVGILHRMDLIIQDTIQNIATRVTTKCGAIIEIML